MDVHGPISRQLLGAVTKAQATQAKGYIESLASTRRGNLTLPPTTAEWLRDLKVDFHALLAERGLCDPRERTDGAAPSVTRLDTFLDGYIARRTDVKAATIIWYQHVRRCLVEFFGANKSLYEINAGDAKDFRRWLTRAKDKTNPKAGGQGLGENTARKRCAIAKQMFADALDRELIARNPFGKMEGLSVGASDGRDYFVTCEEAAMVLQACPDAHWKLLFALSRYGGLRCPSEHLSLLWGDVDFESGKIIVRSPKTAHHEGKEQRVIPLFPELRPYLQKVRDELEADPEFDAKINPISKLPVITR
jgi:integrase